MNGVATEGLGLSIQQASENLGVDKSTVSRIRQKFCDTGCVSKKTYLKDKAYRKLTSTAQLLVLHLVLEKPGVFLNEIQMELATVLMLEVDTSQDKSFVTLLCKGMNFYGRSLFWTWLYTTRIC